MWIAQNMRWVVLAGAAITSGGMALIVALVIVDCCCHASGKPIAPDSITEAETYVSVAAQRSSAGTLPAVAPHGSVTYSAGWGARAG